MGENSELHRDILSINNKIILEQKQYIFQDIGCSKYTIKCLHEKLKEYRYISELHNVKEGHYIRWIKMTDPSKPSLSNGGFICEVIILQDGIQILCKNGLNRMFQIRFNDVYIFQKLSDQENILLNALDYLDLNTTT
jgi:hypothetical protein